MKPHDGIPDGAVRLDAYLYHGQIVICGIPRDDVPEDSPEAHNCDALGCGQHHVLARVELPSGLSQELQLQRTSAPDPEAAPGPFIYCCLCHELHPFGNAWCGAQ